MGGLEGKAGAATTDVVTETPTNPVAEAPQREWIVMLTARSSVRLRGDAIVGATDRLGDTSAPFLRLRNAFFKSTHGPTFKGFIAEARGLATDPDSALGLSNRAMPLLQVAALAANACVTPCSW